MLDNHRVDVREGDKKASRKDAKKHTQRRKEKKKPASRNFGKFTEEGERKEKLDRITTKARWHKEGNAASRNFGNFGKITEAGFTEACERKERKEKP